MHDIDLGRVAADRRVGVRDGAVRIAQVVGGFGVTALEDIELTKDPAPWRGFDVLVDDGNVRFPVARDVSERVDGVAESGSGSWIENLGEYRTIGAAEDEYRTDRIVADAVAVGVRDIPAGRGDVDRAVAVPVADAGDIPTDGDIDVRAVNGEQRACVGPAEDLEPPLEGRALALRGAPERLANDQVVFTVTVEVAR